MANLANGIKLGAIGTFDFAGAGHIVDVGGADGTVLAHMTKMIDLTMLGMLNGRERTRAEYRVLLERAGFEFEAVTATATPVSVITARA